MRRTCRVFSSDRQTSVVVQDGAVGLAPMILRSCFVGGGEKEALRTGAHYGGERQEDEGGTEKTRT